MSSSYEKYILNAEERYKMGLPTLTKLFELNKVDLVNKLKAICRSNIPSDFLENQVSVKKIISDDVPEKIEVRFYACLSITAWGITYKPEHGTSINVVDFNEFFTLG